MLLPYPLVGSSREKNRKRGKRVSTSTTGKECYSNVTLLTVTESNKTRTTQFVKKRDNAVREKQNATTHVTKPKRNDAFREKQNATTQITKPKRNDAVREKKKKKQGYYAGVSATLTRL